MRIVSRALLVIGATAIVACNAIAGINEPIEKGGSSGTSGTSGTSGNPDDPRTAFLGRWYMSGNEAVSQCTNAAYAAQGPAGYFLRIDLADTPGVLLVTNEQFTNEARTGLCVLRFAVNDRKASLTGDARSCGFTLEANGELALVTYSAATFDLKDQAGQAQAAAEASLRFQGGVTCASYTGTFPQVTRQ